MFSNIIVLDIYCVNFFIYIKNTSTCSIFRSLRMVEETIHTPAQNMNSGFYYNTPFSFERDFNEHNAIQWMLENWTVSIWLSLIYIALIFAGRWYMQSRSKYDLRPWLAVWSGVLAIFSILATIRLMSEVIYIVYTYGWNYSVCFPSIYFGDSAFWAWLFTISKAYELGDTMFIILRKQPLIFLHWYHHVTVMIYSWYTYANYYAPGRWFATINSLVHSFMYSYYCLRALRVRVPKKVSMSITFIQISQMIFGCYVNWTAYQVYQRGDACHITDNNIKYSLLMYASYFMLFAHFFYSAYMTSKKTPVTSNKEDENMVIQNGTSNGHLHSSKKTS